MSMDHYYILEVLADSTEEKLEGLAKTIEGFPHGKSSLGEPWIDTAIAYGSKFSIEWMLLQEIDINYIDEQGYSPLLRAIDRAKKDKYEVIELLLESNASIHDHGINDWTPLHMAAVRDDVKALKLLIRYGADPTVKTRTDGCTTPLEEARALNCKKSVKYLEKIKS